jgi:hypothetical protein
LKKIIVINGLARGGTNLAANLFAAQEGWHVSDAAIAEIACIDQFLSKDFVNHYSKALSSPQVKALIDGELEKFKARCVDRVVQTVCPSYHTIKTKYHAEIGSYYGVPIDTWGKYMRDIAAIQSFEALDNIYQDLAERIGCGALAHRTTALTSYAPAFLSRSPNRYWIEIVRDPYDRAISSRKGHAQGLTESFLQSKWQLDHINQIDCDRFIQLRYEDICVDPSKCVEKVCADVGIGLQQFRSEPVTPDMACFYGNSSANPDIFNQVKKEKPIYMDSIGGGNNLSRRERRQGESILKSGRAPVFYLMTLFAADMLWALSRAVQKSAMAVLAFNYLSIIRKSGLRKTGQRCMSRFI